MSIDYEEARKDLAQLLRQTVTAAVTVFDDEPDDLTAASPILVVSRMGRTHPRLTFRGGKTLVTFAVDCYIVPGDGYAALLDQVAHQVDATVDAYQVYEIGGWQAIELEQSTVENGIFNADGMLRFRERTPLTLTFFA